MVREKPFCARGGQMSRQAVIETGSWSVKAGLWEQTFIPTTRIPSFGRIQDGKHVFGGSFDVSCGEEIVRPIIDGRVVNLDLLEELWRHVLGKELGLVEPWTDVHLLLLFPPTWSRPTLISILRLAFERLGVAGVYLGSTPVLAALGCAQSSGLVVDVGHEGTDVALVWEGHLIGDGRYPVGGKDLTKFVGESLAQSDSDGATLGRAVKETAVFEQGQTKFTLNGKQEILGEKDLLDRACSLYFDEADGRFGLHHHILHLLNQVDSDKRPTLLSNLIVTGLGSQLPSLPSRLSTTLTSLLPVSGFSADHQSNKVMLRHVPEYYPEVWQAAGPVAAWFGAGITAKMVFPDAKAHYTREEYSQLGPVQLLAQKPL